MIKDNINRFIQSSQPSQIMVLVDAKVALLYPDYLNFLPNEIPVIKYIVPEGEKSKSIEQVVLIWNELLNNHFDKDALIINLGGGMISDLGGFIASTFKRGISFINIPTTILAMIDASIGGKNGINHNNIKNCIGTINLPKAVYCDYQFIDTLDIKEIHNGFGELIKYALIGNKKMWDELCTIDSLEAKTIKNEWIEACINYKNKIVDEDLMDENLRRKLNFGHTIGHAIESYCLKQLQPIAHGHAIAIGMIFESEISYQHNLLSYNELCEIKDFILRFFEVPDICHTNMKDIANLTLEDKKNKNHVIYITLLEKIGSACINNPIKKLNINTLFLK